MAKLDITKQVPISKQLLSVVETRIGQLGIKFPEYIRHLILDDTKKLMETIPFVTEEEEKDIVASMKDFEQGNVTVLESEADIESHFNKIARKANAS